MLRKNCSLIGKTLKPHGYKGHIKIISKHQLDFNISKINFFFIELEKILVPFFIESIKEINSESLLVKFEKLDSKEQLNRILKKDIYIPSEWINKEKVENNEGHITNYRVFDIEKGELGKVDYVDTQTKQKLIYVTAEKNNFCFPMHEKFLLGINTEKKIITVKIPEELINLN